MLNALSKERLRTFPHCKGNSIELNFSIFRPLSAGQQREKHTANDKWENLTFLFLLPN